MKISKFCVSAQYYYNGLNIKSLKYYNGLL